MVFLRSFSAANSVQHKLYSVIVLGFTLSVCRMAIVELANEALALGAPDKLQLM